MIRDYLVKSVKLRLNNKTVALKWVGKEYENGEVVWCYFEIPKQKVLKTVWIHNTIFTEIYPKQQNIVQITTPKGKKSLLLNKDDNEGSLSF